MEDIDVFQILRTNTNGDNLGTTNPANFQGETSFSKEITRASNAQYDVIIRAVYKDGTVRNSITLQTPQINSVPGVSVDQVEAFAARGNWNQVNNAGVTDYRLRVYLRGTDSLVVEKTVEKGTGSRSSTIDAGLSQGTDYDLIVEALSGSDVAASSARAQFSTPTLAAVPNVSVDQIHLKSFRANWSQLTGATVTNYRIVAYQHGTTNIAVQKTVELGVGDRSSTVDTGLATGTVYDVVVQALNGTQVLSTSATVTFTTSSYLSPTFGPSLSVAFTNVRQTKVVANWSFSGDMDGVDVFTILRTNGDVLSTTNPANFPGDTTFSKEITRASNAQDSVFIRALYKDGTVRDSATLQMPLTAAVPGVSVDQVEAFSMRANWNQADYAGVTDYRLRVYLRGTDSLVVEKTVEKGTGSRSSTIDAGLNQGTAYDLIIEALVGSDVAASSSRVQFTTLTIPAVPNVNVDQVYPKSARANWSQLTGTTITDYRVVVYLHGTATIAAQKTVVIGTGDRSSTVDTGIAESTAYDLVVQALNGSQVVSTSAVVQFTTSSYVTPTFGPSLSVAFTNVRSTKVIVNWSFSGDMEDIDTFTILRTNGENLGTTNPANFPGSTSFSKEITRTAAAQYNVFIRALYKDGTIRDSITLQMPKT